MLLVLFFVCVPLYKVVLYFVLFDYVWFLAPKKKKKMLKSKGPFAFDPLEMPCQR